MELGEGEKRERDEICVCNVRFPRGRLPKLMRIS